MDERPEQTFAPAREVMALHAREELPHLGWDEQVISAPSPRAGASCSKALASLLIVLVVDAKTARVAARGPCAGGERWGSRSRRCALARKRLSRSDPGARGVPRAPAAQALPWSRLLCAILGSRSASHDPRAPR